MELKQLCQALDERAEERPEQALVLEPKRNGSYQELSFRQVADESMRIARGLDSIGIRPGMRCVLMVPPSIEMFTISFALLRIGAVPVMVDPGIGLKHLKNCLTCSLLWPIPPPSSPGPLA